MVLIAIYNIKFKIYLYLVVSVASVYFTAMIANFVNFGNS